MSLLLHPGFNLFDPSGRRNSDCFAKSWRVVPYPTQMHLRPTTTKFNLPAFLNVNSRRTLFFCSYQDDGSVLCKRRGTKLVVDWPYFVKPLCRSGIGTLDHAKDHQLLRGSTTSKLDTYF